MLSNVGNAVFVLDSKIYRSNHTKWTHFGVLSATVGDILLHDLKYILN